MKDGENEEYALRAPTMDIVLVSALTNMLEKFPREDWSKNIADCILKVMDYPEAYYSQGKDLFENHQYFQGLSSFYKSFRLDPSASKTDNAIEKIFFSVIVFMKQKFWFDDISAKFSPEYEKSLRKQWKYEILREQKLRFYAKQYQEVLSRCKKMNQYRDTELYRRIEGYYELTMKELEYGCEGKAVSSQREKWSTVSREISSRKVSFQGTRWRSAHVGKTVPK